MAMLVCGMAVLAFLGREMLGAPLARFMFDPYMILQGEWWRLFPLPISEDFSNPIWFLFYILYIYFVVGALEAEWGAGPLTVFIILSYITAVAGAFIVMEPISIWFYILANVSLAFGTLFPDVELYLFFILPVKAKWLSLLAGAFIFLKFIVGGLFEKLFLLVVLLPFLIFFSPMLYARFRTWRKVRRNRQRFGDDR